MRRLLSCAVVGALAMVLGVFSAQPAGAAGGGNRGTARVCQHGGWMALGSASGVPFANPGDCVSAQARGLGLRPGSNDPQTVCLAIPGRPTFTSRSDGSWTCSYLTPPGPATPTVLELPCVGGDFSWQNVDGLITVDCTPELT